MRNNLRDNFKNANARFMYIEKRFDSDESLFEIYNEIMKEQFKGGGDNLNV